MQETTPFEQFIMTCCELDEWDLRGMLRAKLTEAGFSIQEDDYKSHRGGRYQEVHNMLAIRGTPQVCMVAHTDVCRDHRSSQNHVKATPVIKIRDQIIGDPIRIIQDEHCKVQVGGDDRLGVAIGTWIALNTDSDIAMLYTTDEEVGNQSADEVRFPELGKFDLLVQIDRGNHSNQLVTNIGGTRLCTAQTAQKLIELSNKIGLPRFTVQGMMTDVLAIRGNGRCREAVNMTCGYHRSFGSSPEEFIDIEEAINTKTYVEAIIKFYASKKLIGDTEFSEADHLVSENLNASINEDYDAWMYY